MEPFRANQAWQLSTNARASGRQLEVGVLSRAVGLRPQQGPKRLAAVRGARSSLPAGLGPRALRCSLVRPRCAVPACHPVSLMPASLTVVAVDAANPSSLPTSLSSPRAVPRGGGKPMRERIGESAVDHWGTGLKPQDRSQTGWARLGQLVGQLIVDKKRRGRQVREHPTRTGASGCGPAARRPAGVGGRGRRRAQAVPDTTGWCCRRGKGFHTSSQRYVVCWEGG